MRRLNLTLLFCLYSATVSAGFTIGGPQALKFIPPAAAAGGCNAAGTAIALVTTSNTTGATTVNKTWTKPTGTTTDDVEVAYLHIENDAPSVTPPSGWTLFVSTANKATSPDSYVFGYYLRAGGSEPANYTWSFSSSFSQVTGAAYRNVNTGCGPLDSTTSSNTFTATNAYTLKSVTTSGANSWLIGEQDNFEGNANNEPTGYTEDVDTVQMALMHKNLAAAGASGDSASATISASGNGSCTLTSLRD